METPKEFILNRHKKDSNGCWIWTRTIHPRGYGHLGYMGKKFYAHRFSYMAFNGKIPPGMFVCHRCDVPTCVNPKHLWIGTCSDNNKDMAKKGRARNRPRYGADHHAAKLNDKKVREIRKLYSSGAITMKQLAKKYGVHPGTIGQIIRRKIWVFNTRDAEREEQK